MKDLFEIEKFNNETQANNHDGFTVIDAVMGTGKSTWAIQELDKTDKRCIVLLPYKAEVERYWNSLTRAGVVALHEDIKGMSKQNRFELALNDSDVILTTHALFADFLKPDVFTIIEQGGWHLMMDETIGAFEPIKSMALSTLAGWKAKGIVEVREMNQDVKMIIPVAGTADMYSHADDFTITKGERELLKQSMIQDMLMIERSDSRGFFSFSLSEYRLQSFASVTVLTYMFKGSDLDYWCRMKDAGVEHLSLTRSEKDKAYNIEPHDGQYSGETFKDFIEILDVKEAGYGSKPGQLSATSSKDLHKKSKAAKTNISDIQKDLKRHFKNRKMEINTEPEDFMYTSLKEISGVWAGKDLPMKFIGDDTFVSFNKRGTNDYGTRHNLAFLFNVFQNPTIKALIESESIFYSGKAFALSTLVQWIWRSAIRNGEKIRLYIPSKRMRDLLTDWLNGEFTLP